MLYASNSNRYIELIEMFKNVSKMADQIALQIKIRYNFIYKYLLTSCNFTSPIINFHIPIYIQSTKLQSKLVNKDCE